MHECKRHKAYPSRLECPYCEIERLEAEVERLKYMQTKVHEMGKREGRKKLQGELAELLNIKECTHDDG